MVILSRLTLANWLLFDDSTIYIMFWNIGPFYGQWHSRESEYSVMGCKCSPATIFIRDFQLPVPASSILCGEYRGVPKRFNAVFFVWYGVLIWNGNCIKLVIVHPESEFSVHLRCKHDG